MLLMIVLAIYFLSMAVAVYFMVRWLLGQKKGQPNHYWKAMLGSMVVIFIAGMGVSFIRNQQYVAEQKRLARIATRKVRLEDRDLLRVDVTAKSGYDDALVLVMQPNRHNGILDKLNGSILDQKDFLRNAQQAMYRERKNPAAKTGGILIVSYVKDGKKFKPTLALYASKHAVKHIGSTKYLGTTAFLEHDLSAYYFNKKYLNNTDSNSIFATLPLQDTRHFTKLQKKKILRGKVVFVKDVKHKHKHKKTTKDSSKQDDTSKRDDK